MGYFVVLLKNVRPSEGCVYLFLYRDVRSNQSCSLETPVEMHVNGKVGTDGLRAVWVLVIGLHRTHVNTKM